MVLSDQTLEGLNLLSQAEKNIHHCVLTTGPLRD